MVIVLNCVHEPHRPLSHRVTISCLFQVGIATSLSAFLQLNELSDEEEEEDDLLKEGM